ncbi:hypothetical protein [Streptomyces iconiensis]|uniref:Integral membrane protein n=1 Tax=Streptomyces iconiensis TaxID=1384038 RepID=A0ABT6ZUT8_9ACTN|nr:hypothetical protein [Streptomyces iconiensis]MDJ1132579.1 hypothetical protein [Streptomyces iconiensis]
MTFTARPLTLLLRLLLLCASAGIGLLLLATLAHALDRPARPVDSTVRLLWCLVPLAVAAQVAAALARTVPHEARQGLVSAGVGPVRLRWLAAFAAGMPCLLGSALVFLTFAGLDDAGVLALPGVQAELPLPGRPLPLPATFTLLSTVPLVAACAAAVATARASREEARNHTHGEPRPERHAPRSVPAWGGALVMCGLAVASYGARALPHGGQDTVRADALVASPLPVGWLMAAAGMVLAGPGLAHLCGRLLAGGRPGPVRLLSGRGIQREAHCVGRPLGALCAVGAALLAFTRVRSTGDAAPLPGPLVATAVALVVCGVAGAALAALARARRTREPAQEILVRLGAPHRLRRITAFVRAAALSAVLVPPVVVTGQLAALPLL